MSDIEIVREALEEPWKVRGDGITERRHIVAALAALDRIEAERDLLREQVGGATRTVSDAFVRVSAENERLREALAPFARLFDGHFDEKVPNEAVVLTRRANSGTTYHELTVADFIAARAALQPSVLPPAESQEVHGGIYQDPGAKQQDIARAALAATPSAEEEQ